MKSIILFFAFFILASTPNAQIFDWPTPTPQVDDPNTSCNEAALANCDMAYDYTAQQLETQYYQNINNCLSGMSVATDEMAGLFDWGDVPTPGDIPDPWDIIDAMMEDFHDTYPSVDGAIECLWDTEAGLWDSYFDVVDQWHECEGDPNHGNCPNRHD